MKKHLIIAFVGLGLGQANAATVAGDEVIYSPTYNSATTTTTTTTTYKSAGNLAYDAACGCDGGGFGFRSPFYFGAGIGQSRFDNIFDLASSLSNASYSDRKDDNKDLAYKIFGGWAISRWLSTELQYADLGSFAGAGVSSLSSTSVRERIDADLTSIGLSAVLKAPTLAGRYQPFVKLGYHRWDGDLKQTGGPVNVKLSADGADPFYGVGLNVNIVRGWFGRIEYERFDVEDENVDLVTASAIYRF